MERYVRFIVRNRVAVVITVMLITAVLAVQLRHVHLEIRRRAQLPQHHANVKLQNRIADLFGGETTLLVGVVARQGDIFTPTILDKIVRLTREFQELPGVVPGNVFSIAANRVKAIRGTSQGLDIRPIIETTPESAEAISELKDYLLGEKLYRGTLVAEDGSAAAIVVDFDEQLSDSQIHASVEQIVAPARDGETDIVLAGAPLIRSYIGRYTQTMAVLFPIAVLVIALVHYEAFRTLQAMFLPLVTALLSVTWALGIMGFLRQPMDTWSAVTPVVILAVAAGHAVQILKRYYEEYNIEPDSETAVIRSLSAVGPVMVTAGLIASAGFASLATFRVTSVQVFGMLLAFGILSALAIEMTFTPACRAWLPPPLGRELAREGGGLLLTRVLDKLTNLVIWAPRAVLLTAFAVACACLIGISSIKVDNSFKEWFAADTPLRRDDAVLNSHFAGSSTLHILIEGQKDGDLEEPAVLRAIADLESFLTDYPEIGAATSISDYIARMHAAMNDERADLELIPDNRRLIAQYLFLYSLSGPDDFASIVDPNHRIALIRAYSKTDESQFAQELFRQVRDFTKQRFADLPIHVGIAGGALGVQAAMNEVIVREKVINVAQVSVIIFLLSALVLRSVVGGLIVLTPLTLAVLVNLGTMGWTNTWLSMATAAITAMGVSIGADFAIYLIFRIREELPRHQSIEAALRAAILTSGKAIFFVSSAVALGYLTLLFSGFSIWIHLGLLTALMMVVSALGSLTIIPALTLVARPSVLFRPRPWSARRSRRSASRASTP